jgi:hypothetical protein
MFKVFTRLSNFVRNLRTIVSGGLGFFAGVWRRRTALAVENLFLRKQLALFREREKKAMPTTPADRFVFSKLAGCFDWRSALMIVKPATLIGWQRIPAVLALEIETGREAPSDCRSQGLDSAFSG